MRRLIRSYGPVALLAVLLPLLYPQTGARGPRAEERPVRLPSGKLQQEEILKADHEKSLKDAGQLLELAEQLKIDLEKNGGHVLSLDTLKKTEEIEKLVKRIRSRLRRF
ncbi:MAG: hypothetical protein WD696_20730 [Bryobacteraceae bacterium]